MQNKLPIIFIFVCCHQLVCHKKKTGFVNMIPSSSKPSNVHLSFHIAVTNQYLQQVHICCKLIIRMNSNKTKCSPLSLTCPASSAVPLLSSSSASIPRSSSLHFWLASILGNSVTHQKWKESQELTSYFRPAGKRKVCLL